MAEQYNSNFTGPEIDAILGGSVRYDLAQSLTAAQQAQARGNIAAAPDGYGLGGACVPIGTASPDTITANGWYQFGADNTYFPISAGELLVIKRTTDQFTTQILLSEDSTIPLIGIRKQTGGAWTPWEWFNPPLALGVEYRTTERYNGKPVYVRVISSGAMPAAAGIANRAKVGANFAGMKTLIRWEGTVTNGTDVATFPVSPGNGMTIALCGYWYGGTVYIEAKGDYSAYSGTLTFWYTKTTD